MGAVRDGELEAVRGLVQASRLVSQSDEARLGVQRVGVLVVTRHYHVLQLRDVGRVAVTRFHLSVNNISWCYYHLRYHTPRLLAPINQGSSQKLC